MSWNQSLSVNVPHLDEQHKAIVGMVNDLHEAMMRMQGKSALKSILARLVDYTAEHFAAEEDFMRENGFAGLEAHRAEHERLTREVRELQRRVDNNEAHLTIEVMRFLQSWLVDHIQDQDKQYAPTAATR